MGLFGAGDPPCPAGSICSGQAKTDVGKTYKTTEKLVAGGSKQTVTETDNPGTGIYHASATKLNSDGTSTTDVYIIKIISGKRLLLQTTVGRHIPMMIT